MSIIETDTSRKMTILQSTRLTLTKSMPLIFDHKSSVWPDPEQSIGEECLRVGGLKCWLPIGPALAAFEVLSKDLQDLLDKHKDALKQGEPKPRAISFNMWMIGSKPESSHPTIVFSSKSLRQRAFAKALLKDSKLLDQYPGVRIKTLDRMPAIYRAGSQEPNTIEMAFDRIDDVHSNDSEEAVYMVDNSRGSCGALIAFGRLRLATMGGTLLINGTYYGISAQHGRYKFLEEPEDATNEDNSLCFDDHSDTEDSDLENLVEITSRESISSFSDDGSSTFTSTSTPSTKDGFFGDPIDFSRTTESTLDDNLEVPSPSQPTYSSNPKISNLLPYERNDLDYEVFEIGDFPYHNPNKIDLPSSGYPIRRIIPNKVARTVVECPVWAATGTTGCVQGTMMRQPYYIKMEGSETFQEMWAVKLDRNTKPGDSGAWVVDSAGQLFGHIVAGDPMLGLAFIIPAYKIFDDIKSRFGEEPLLCPSPSVMQPFSAPNDGKVAERPLLRQCHDMALVTRWDPSRILANIDNRSCNITCVGYPRTANRRCHNPIAAENQAKAAILVTEMSLWFPGRGKTVIAELCARHVTSIGYGHPVEEIAKLKEIAEIRLKQNAANWTLPERTADFLQEAVYRGNILGTSLILTGTSNQLMPATFYTTASSAQPSSFGSNVTFIIDALDEAYNGTMDPSTIMTVGSPYVDFNNYDHTVEQFTFSTCLSIPTDDDIALAPGFIDDLVDDDLALNSDWLSVPPTSFPASSDISAHCQKRKASAPRRRSLIRGSLRSQTGEPSCCVRCLKGSQFVQETQSVEQQIPHWCRWFLPDIARLQPMRLSAAETPSWSDMLKEHLIARLSESESGIVPIREARMQMQELHPLDQDGNQQIPYRFSRRRLLQDTPRLQPMRFSAPEDLRLIWSDMLMKSKRRNLQPPLLRISYLRKSASGIVPIREARMQMQELHPVDQDGNQQIPHWYTPRYTRRRISPDIPRLQPMRVPHLDSGPYHCGFCDAQHTDPRSSSFDRHLHRLLHVLDTSQRDEDSGTEKIESLSCYLILLFCSHYSCAVPDYDARQSRRRRLNAPQRRENNSQFSESSGKA